MSRLIPNANNNKGVGGGGERTGSFVVTERCFCHFTESRPAHSTEGATVGGSEERSKEKKRKEQRRKNKNKSAVKVTGSLRQVQ